MGSLIPPHPIIGRTVPSIQVNLTPDPHQDHHQQTVSGLSLKSTFLYLHGLVFNLAHPNCVYRIKCYTKGRIQNILDHIKMGLFKTHLFVKCHFSVFLDFTPTCYPVDS